MRWLLLITLCLSIGSIAQAFGQATTVSYTLLVFADGTVRVTQVVQVDPEDPVASVRLVAASFEQLLAWDEHNSPLTFELAGPGVINVNTLGASRVTLSYDSNALATQDGPVWSLRIDLLANATIFLPNNSHLLFVNPQPIRVASNSSQTLVLVSPGSWEVSFDILQAQPQPRSGCVIATATFGADRNRLETLRVYRDAMASNLAGKSFIEYFNAWYYSWSPGLAESIYRSPLAREAVRLALTPLLAALDALPYLMNSSLGREAGIHAAGIVVSAVVGAVYLTPIVFGSPRFARTSIRAIPVVLAVALAASPMAPISSVLLVLSSAVLGAALASKVLAAILSRAVLSRSSRRPS